MRDPARMELTEEIIRAAGHASRVQGVGWVAGVVPLNGQIVQDMIEDGWLAIDPTDDALRLRDQVTQRRD